MVTVEDIVDVPTGRGWEAEIAEELTMPALIRTSPIGILNCSNGRLSGNSSMDGLKALGGVYAITINRGITNVDRLKKVVEEVKPTVTNMMRFL